MGSLEELVAVVTGAGSGIGLASTQLLRERGAFVGALDLHPGRSEDGIAALEADVRDRDSLDAAVRSVAEQFGGVDILVNNAGIGAAGTVEDNPEEEWRRVFDVNVFGMMRASRAALPHLRRSSHPAIVNVCSVAARVGLPQRACYSASKGAVLSLTLSMAADLLDDGIRVNCVCPGTADTPWVGRLLDAAPDPAAERAALEARQPMGRLGSAREVAHAIVWLADPGSSFVSGTALDVDGGLTGLRVPPKSQ
jgi:2-keto-3-deoxy-L-fuconate dehydrogenase